MMENTAFYIFSVPMVAFGVYMLAEENPIKAAFSLLCIFILTAGIYLYMNMYLISALQVIIYAGGIMALFVVAITSLPSGKRKDDFFIFRPVLFFAILISLFFLGFLLKAMESARVSSFLHETNSSILDIAQALFYQHTFQFELISLLIVAAIISAVVLLRREK